MPEGRLQEVKVIVVGAGIVGCATAYELACRGADVHVIDSRGVGRGASQASAGALAPHIEGRSAALLDLCLRSLHAYDEFVARVRQDADGPIEYGRSGTLEVALDEPQAERLRAMARAADAAACMRYLDGAARGRTASSPWPRSRATRCAPWRAPRGCRRRRTSSASAQAVLPPAGEFVLFRRGARVGTFALAGPGGAHQLRAARRRGAGHHGGGRRGRPGVPGLPQGAGAGGGGRVQPAAGGGAGGALRAAGGRAPGAHRRPAAAGELDAARSATCRRWTWCAAGARRWRPPSCRAPASTTRTGCSARSRGRSAPTSGDGGGRRRRGASRGSRARGRPRARA